MKSEPYDPNKAPERLRTINSIVNRVNWKLTKRRDHCVLCSFALTHVLKVLGHAAIPLRVSMTAFPDDRMATCVSLGSEGDGTRMKAASKNMWNGHLCVLAENKWLLDPTSDQVNRKDILLPPISAELASLTYEGDSTMLELAGCSVRYRVFKRQNGFINAGCTRRSKWWDVAQLSLLEFSKLHK